MLSEKIQRIKPSPTLAITSKAKAMKAAGEDVIGFGAGEPDFNTPDNIKQAAKKAIDNNITRYTPVGGIPALKEAVVNKFRRVNKIDYDVSEVMISCGGKHTLYNIAVSLLNKDDEAIVESLKDRKELWSKGKEGITDSGDEFNEEIDDKDFETKQKKAEENLKAAVG